MNGIVLIGHTTRFEYMDESIGLMICPECVNEVLPIFEASLHLYECPECHFAYSEDETKTLRDEWVTANVKERTK